MRGNRLQARPDPLRPKRGLGLLCFYCAASLVCYALLPVVFTTFGLNGDKQALTFTGFGFAAAVAVFAGLLSRIPLKLALGLRQLSVAGLLLAVLIVTWLVADGYTKAVSAGNDALIWVFMIIPIGLLIAVATVMTQDISRAHRLIRQSRQPA